MRPVSLWINGSFWDTQIYSGELTLLDNDGGINKIDWEGVIDDLATENPSIQTALRVAFSDSDLFYTQKVRKILRDPAIEVVIKGQLNALQTLQVDADAHSWERHWRTTQSPFDFLPIDTDIYYNHLFAGGDEGLFSAPRGQTSLSRGKGRLRKHHDGQVLQVRASNQATAIAAAGGSDGLFEFAFQSSNEDVLKDPRQLAQLACNACDWAFYSIVAWSPESAYFANFIQEVDPQSRRTTRRFDRIIRQGNIFENLDTETLDRSFVWGSHEKMFRLSDQGLEVLQYNASPSGKSKKKANDQSHKPFAAHGHMEFAAKAGDLVSTGTAPFGSVLEFSDRIVVLRSDGEIEEFPDEPVHWRVFPRSEHYSNQLHIIYPDRMRVVSFVHDYFVDQETKLTGFARGSNDYISTSKRSNGDGRRADA